MMAMANHAESPNAAYEMNRARASADPGLSATELFQRADIALYEAKKSRGRCQMFDERLQQRLAQVWWEFVHHPAGDSLDAAHGSIVVSRRARSPGRPIVISGGA